MQIRIRIEGGRGGYSDKKGGRFVFPESNVAFKWVIATLKG